MALLLLHYDPSQTISANMEQSKIICRCLTWSLSEWKRRVGGRNESEISANPKCGFRGAPAVASRTFLPHATCATQLPQ